jgi:hypothetical protein
MRHVGRAKADLIRELQKKGWTAEPGRKHIKLRSPGNQLVIMSKTSVSMAGFRNARALIRRILENESTK